MKRRGLTLAGSIVGTVLFGLMTFGQVIMVPIIATSANIAINFDGTVDEVMRSILYVLFALSLISLMFYIVCLVLNACTIPASSASPEKYRAKRGLIISTIVFNFITFLYSFGVSIFACLAYMAIINIFNIFMLFGVLTSGILLLVDLCREKSRVQEWQNSAPRPIPPQQVAPPRPAPENKPEGSIEMLEFELTRLNRLKANGVITEEECNNLKQKILENFK